MENQLKKVAEEGLIEHIFRREVKILNGLQAISELRDMIIFSISVEYWWVILEQTRGLRFI